MTKPTTKPEEKKIDYSKLSLAEKMAYLKKPIPFKFRVGSGATGKKTVGGKTVYDTYLVLPYINARDCQDRMDEIFGLDWSRKYVDVSNKAYCEVSIWDGSKWITRSDVGAKSNIAAEKGESSDGFKRACVNFGLGRFLYEMPVLYITHEEQKQNRDITNFIKTKYKELLLEYRDKEDAKLINALSKYKSEDDEIENDDLDSDGVGMIKKEMTDNILLVQFGKWKNKKPDEILKEALQLKKEYDMSEEIEKKLNEFLAQK